MDAAVEKIFRHTAVRYRGMLARLRPCKPGSEFLEQNLVTLFCHEFLAEHPCGIVYTELPFSKDDVEGDWSQRLDALLATDHDIYFLEAKCLSNKPDNFSAVRSDLMRMKSAGLHASLQVMASGTKRDDRAYSVPLGRHALIIADCWLKDTADKWLSSSYFPADDILSGLTRKAYHIARFGAYEYYMLAGYMRLPA